MPQKWNLQDIRPSRPERPLVKQRKMMDAGPSEGIRRPSRSTIEERPTRALPQTEYDDLDIIDGNSKKRWRVVVISLVAIFVLGGAYAVNVLMEGADVTVYPKFKDVSVQATFTTEKSPGAGALGFELLSLEATGERQVDASGSEKVSERALGTIFIYNTDQKATQRLIKNTRFESPDGLVYRIKESVEVPAASLAENGSIAPGVITAEIFADGTGEQYNIPAARFTVPGLKGTPQFATVYGETTVTLTGGFEGEKYIIDDSELETKKQELHLELRNNLLARLKAERPSGFILYDDAVTFTFEALPATAYGGAQATIKERALLHVPLFKQDDFAAYIADSTIAGYEGEAVRLKNPEALKFSYAGATTSISDISNQTELSFNLMGTTRIEWVFDEEKLQSDLIGLSKNGLPAVLSSYPSINRAEAVIRPFWATEFPESPNEIKITTILEQPSP